MTDIKILLSLFFTFMKIGGFTLGGGYAMIPIIQREIVDVKKWATEEEMLDYITVAQSLPGVIGINTSTAVGNRVAGKRGAIAATCGMVVPSLVVIIIIAALFATLQEIPVVQRAFNGVRAAVAALIVAAVVRIIKSALERKLGKAAFVFQICLLTVTFACIVFVETEPQIMLLVCAAAALIYRSAVKTGTGDKGVK